ncbi:hypothetical protein NVP1121O_201 [Vibrio phage 1.121.O._10N.286.46.C4]|nr:hypothetical protein NVP1121O_201 [Vibrio phage 1.121.O._10N.286.46.C4]
MMEMSLKEYLGHDPELLSEMEDARDLAADFRLFSKYFYMKNINGITTVFNRDTDAVMKRAKSRPVMDKWILDAIDVLKTYYKEKGDE